MPQVILISQAPLPYSGIGSWTTLYLNYLKSEHNIDYIVCKKPSYQLQNVQYAIVKNNIGAKLNNRLLKNPYNNYLQALKTILLKNEKYIIQVIDNFGIIKPLQEFLLKNGLRNNCYIQFFFHGFDPFYGNFESRFFFETINEMVLLTHDSYKVYKEFYTVLPCTFSVLHNGIDTKIFMPVAPAQKILLQKKFNVSGKKVFVWCSQDRPKKGLELILQVWKKIYPLRQNIVLWVIGCEPKAPQEGVIYLGKIPNQSLPEYFQAADCYLFPTLWHEGFGMSLIEALHCGNYCIASAFGGVPEVLQYGKLGRLIQNPNFMHEWETAILEYLDSPILFEPIKSDLYSADSWSSQMNQIIINAKTSF